MKKRSKAPSRSRSQSKKKQSAGKNVTSVQIARVSEMVSKNQPEYIKAVMRYAESYTVDPGASAIGVHIYRANTIYDVDVTIGGLQPPGFDDYMRLYSRFTVLGARAKVCFANTVLAEPAWSMNTVGISCLSTGSALADQEVYIANGDCNWTVMGRDYSTRTLTLEVDVAKFFGQNIWNDDVFSGSASADAARQCYFHVWSKGDEDLGLVHYTIEIEYDVAFRTINSKVFS